MMVLAIWLEVTKESSLHKFSGYPHAFYVCTLLKTIDIIAAYKQVNVMTGSLREVCSNIESILKNGVQLQIN